MSHGQQRKISRRREAAARCIAEKNGNFNIHEKPKRTFSNSVPKREVKHFVEVKTLKNIFP
jgi:ribosomal protein S9